MDRGSKPSRDHRQVATGASRQLPKGSARRDVNDHQQAVVDWLVERGGLTLEHATRLFEQSYLPRAYERYPEQSLHEDPGYLARKLLTDYRIHTLV